MAARRVKFFSEVTFNTEDGNEREKAKRAKKAAKTKLATMAVTLPQPPTAEAIYEQIVKPLPTPERFKLAQLILTDIPLSRRRGLQRGMDGRGHARLSFGDAPLCG